MVEPVGSPRRVCIDKGGKWDAATQTCKMPDRREEAAEGQVAKGNQIIVTDPQGVRRIQTPETLKADKNEIDIQRARQQALATGQLSGKQSLEAKEAKKQQAQELVNVLPDQEQPIEEAPQQIPTEELPINPETQLPFATPEELAEYNLRHPLQAIGGQLANDPLEAISAALLATPLGKLGISAKAGAKGAPSLINAGKGILKSPATAKIITEGLKDRLLSSLALATAFGTGLIVKNLTGAEIRAIESEVTKYGEQLTKIPEAAKLGLKLEGDQLAEYTIPEAIQDVRDMQDILDEYEVELQTRSIGNTILKLTGRYQSAQIEIEKQRRETDVAMGKLIAEQLNPTQSRLDAEEMFRLIELHGIVKQ